jgi:pyruvate,orthophosphate dikinase
MTSRRTKTSRSKLAKKKAPSRKTGGAKKQVAKKKARPARKKAVRKKATAAGRAPKAGKSRYVYYFTPRRVDGRASDKFLLGGKGANLAEMAYLGMPVPPGFTISTEVCTHTFKSKGQYPRGLDNEVRAAIEQVGSIMQKGFGDPDNPLLLSVRSGAPASMPGMMDTVLNIGLNDETVEGLINRSGDPRFAWDAYRRFVTMYADVVLDFEHDYEFRDTFEQLLEEQKQQSKIQYDYEIPWGTLKDLVQEYKRIVKQKMGASFPGNPMDQIWGAIGAVFNSWNNPRAITYRRLNRLPDDWGTAVNVQAMVFGNMGDTSATGVAFTRDPATGEKRFFGEWLPNAQGEDVVAGIRTLEVMMPTNYRELVRIYQKLEKHYRDMQDIEFTIEDDKLWMLQTRG